MTAHERATVQVLDPPATEEVQSPNGRRSLVALPALPPVRVRSRWSVAAPARDFVVVLLAAVTVLAVTGRLSTLDIGWSVLVSGLSVIALHGRGTYRFRFRTGMLEDTGDLLYAIGLAGLLTLAVQIAALGADVQPREAVLVSGAAFLALLGTRARAQFRRRRSLRNGDGGIATLIVGVGDVGRLIARRLIERREFGLRPVGFLDTGAATTEPGDSVPVLGTAAEFEHLVQAHGIRHIIVTFPTASSGVSLQLVRRCRRLGVGVSIVPQSFEHFTGRIEVEHLGGVAVVHPGSPDPRGWQFKVKYAVDRALGVLVLPLVLPIGIAAAVAVRLSSPGPIFFRQPRAGLDGKEFEMLKFRTMRGTAASDGEADAAWLAGIGVASRPEASVDRTTAVGRFLRRTAIDELPQLWNIIKGDMSWVGPRPERVRYVRILHDRMPGYGDRHRVKGGLTGWAQVQGLRGETSLADRVEWDNYYIENWSLWLDLKIVLLTPLAMLHLGGAGRTAPGALND